MHRTAYQPNHCFTQRVSWHYFLNFHLKVKLLFLSPPTGVAIKNSRKIILIFRIFFSVKCLASTVCVVTPTTKKKHWNEREFVILQICPLFCLGLELGLSP